MTAFASLLDKALYGCVEASSLWFDNLRETHIDYGFIQNPNYPSIFNDMTEGGKQNKVVFQVDDIMINSPLDNLSAFLKQR